LIAKNNNNQSKKKYEFEKEAEGKYDNIRWRYSFWRS
jgi:hypothetical protein